MMDRFIKLCLVVPAALIAAACQREIPVAADLSVSESAITVTKLGVTVRNTVPHAEVTSDTYWMAFLPEGCDWIEMSPKGSAAGVTDVSFVVGPNIDGESRKAEIRFETADGTSATLVLAQEGMTGDVVIIADDYGEAPEDDTEIRYARLTWYGVGTDEFTYGGENAYVSGDFQSSGYEGASAGANVVIGPGGSIVFNRIAASFAGSFRLCWGQWDQDSSLDFDLFCSADAVLWEPVPYVLDGEGPWKSAGTKLIFDESSDWRYFKFVNNSASDKRIDDFRMTDAIFSEDDYTVVSAVLPGPDASWNEGDEITVFSGKDAIRFSRYGEGNAFRSIYGLMPASYYAALCPYDGEASFRDGVISFELPAVQEYGNGRNTYMPMAATSADPSEFRLACLMGVLRVKASCETAPSSIAFVSEDKAVCGSAQVASGVLSVMQDGGRSVVLENISGVGADSDGQMTFDIVLPAGSYGKYVIKAMDQSGETAEYPMENLSVQAGEVSEVEVDFTPSAAISLNMPSYYGESGQDKVYANCWRISAPGEYVFVSADASGNSVKGADATWVWATSGTWNGAPEAVLSAMVTDIRYADDCVRFTVPEDFVPGNVILAVTDVDGMICGSWHVWLTVGPEDISAGGNDWMDRNLGASYAFDPVDDAGHCNAARGFYFQWGCKNPVVGIYDQTAANGDSFTMGKGATWYIYNGSVRNTGEWGTLSEYPSSWTSTYDEMMRYPMSMFPDNVRNPAYGKTDSWPRETDPCPYGYRVPSREQMSSLGKATVISDSETPLKNVAIVRSGVVFPSCGYRKNTGAVAISGNPDMRYWTDASYNSSARYYWLANKSNNKEMYAGLETGMNVRCVKIKK